MISHVETVAVYVGDQTRALGFYVDQLGLEVRKDTPMGPDGSLRWIEVAPEGAQTVLVLFTPPGLEHRIGASSGLVLQCSDIKATAEQLEARGVEFTQAPTLTPFGWWARLQDPDGNELGLSQAE